MCDIYIFYIFKKIPFNFQILYELLVKTELHHLSFSFSSLQALQDPLPPTPHMFLHSQIDSLYFFDHCF